MFKFLSREVVLFTSLKKSRDTKLFAQSSITSVFKSRNGVNILENHLFDYFPGRHISHVRSLKRGVWARTEMELVKLLHAYVFYKFESMIVCF